MRKGNGLTQMTCEVRPEKDDPNRTRITIGGYHICYPGNVDTNTASLELVKLLLNSVLSWKGAHFSSIDLKNFYLATPMLDPGYIQIKILTYRQNSSRNTILPVGTMMDGFTLKSAEGVMVSPKPTS